MKLGSKVLVATDLSESADEAIRQGHERARAAQGELLVLCVVPDLIHKHPLFAELPDTDGDAVLEPEQRVTRAVHARVQALTGHLPGPYRVLVANGAPDSAILRAAEEEGVSLLVVGILGATGLDSVMLGSVAALVVRHAGCPVLVARPHAKTGRILAATDFSDPAYAAVVAAGVEAKASGAKVTLLHSSNMGPGAGITLGGPLGAAFEMPSPDLVVEVRSAAAKALDDLLAQFGIEGEGLSVDGDPTTVILQAARDVSADLVVVSMSDRSDLSRWLLGSVVEKVIAEAPCSVLAVRRG